jgi:DNA-binding protein H-NS
VKGLRLELLTTSELLDVRDYVDTLLKQRVGNERREIEKTLARISEATHDRTQPGRSASKLRGRKVPPKYRDVKTGETWSGRGATPRWLRALMKQGRKLEDFAIGKESRKKKPPARKRASTGKRTAKRRMARGK